MTEPTLEELATVYGKAYQHYRALGEKYHSFVPETHRMLTPPLPLSEPDYLDAWANYQIARRRYERALLRSRRGEVE